MKNKIVLVLALMAVPFFFIACGDDPKSVEIKKKARLKIWPTGYEDMTEEEVDREIKAAEAEQETAGDRF